MKKIYNKPNLNIEFFALSQSVANGCGVTSSVPGGNSIGRPNHWEKTTCGWEMGSDVIWLEDGSICNIHYGANDDVYGMCYNNPEGGNTIFAS